MNLIERLARAAAGVAHAAVAEYRRLDAPPPKAEPAHTEINNTSGSSERKWSPHQEAPASPRAFGIRGGGL